MHSPHLVVFQVIWIFCFYFQKLFYSHKRQCLSFFFYWNFPKPLCLFLSWFLCNCMLIPNVFWFDSSFAYSYWKNHCFNSLLYLCSLQGLFYFYWNFCITFQIFSSILFLRLLKILFMCSFIFLIEFFNIIIKLIFLQDFW